MSEYDTLKAENARLRDYVELIAGLDRPENEGLRRRASLAGLIRSAQEALEAEATEDELRS